jgi:hypothetical protein
MHTPRAQLQNNTATATRDDAVSDQQLLLLCIALCCMQVYSYELLLRRLMLRAPTAAFLALAAFRFSDFAAVDPATGSQMTVPNPFFNAGRLRLVALLVPSIVSPAMSPATPITVSLAVSPMVASQRHFLFQSRSVQPTHQKHLNLVYA